MRKTSRKAASVSRGRGKRTKAEPRRARRLRRSTIYIRWIEAHCRIPEGKDVGKPVRLRAWQKRELAKIYDNPAMTRRAIISFAKKNGKTALCAFLLLLHLVGPAAVANSQLYSTAQSREQAAIIFDLAAKCVRLSPSLRDFIAIRDSAKVLACLELGTRYRALSADVDTAEGVSPIFVIHDELGRVRGPRSGLYESLEMAAGAHDHPLSLIISTQAEGEEDLLSVLIDDAAAGHDPRVTLSLYAADPKADPFSVQALRAANPAYGDFLNPQELRDNAAAAKRMPAREPMYRNRHLNQRVRHQTRAPLISRPVWDACNAQPEPLAGAIVYAALDLSMRTDLTALVALAERGDFYDVHTLFWTPEEGLYERAMRDRAPYDLWVQQGFLRTTPGATVDYAFVVADIAALFEEVAAVEALAYDRWRIDAFQRELDAAGMTLNLVPHGQGYKDMSPAIDAVEELALNRRLRHGGHPVLSMCVANATPTRDPAGNRKLDKSRATGRIDGMVSLTMAAGIATVPPPAPEAPRESIYSRGVL